MSVIALDRASRLVAGRYVLEREIGRGRTATVFAAHDERLDRRVAIKVVPVAATESVGRDRFVREARSAAGFCHPNAVAVFDAGEADGFLYIVMELIDGQSLAEVMAELGPLEPSQAAAIAMSVLDVIGQAHAAGIVHRDVKPSNIMVSDDGHVKLLDFGIARRLDNLTAVVTAPGELIGTPTYLAPEEIDGRPTGPATDVYAIGVVLYEMLAGTAPFYGDTPLATALAHTNAPVPDVRTLRPDVTESLAAAIQTAMAKDPDQRFTDAAAMQAALSDSQTPAVYQPAVLEPEPTQFLPSNHHRRRLPTAWALAGSAALATAGLFAWNVGQDLVWLLTSNDSPPAQASSPDPPEVQTTVSPTSSAAVTTTAPIPTTIDGVIAALQANPAGYGQHTAEIIDELTAIQQGDKPIERAGSLLEMVATWADNGEATAATVSMLEVVLTPFIESASPNDPGDSNGNGNGGDGGNGNGNGNGRGNGNGNGGGNGNGRGRNK